MSIFDTSPYRPDGAGEEAGEFADLPRTRTPEAKSLLDRIDELLDVCDAALSGCVDYPGAPGNGRFFSTELMATRIDRALDAYAIDDPAELVWRRPHAVGVGHVALLSQGWAPILQDEYLP